MFTSRENKRKLLTYIKSKLDARQLKLDKNALGYSLYFTIYLFNTLVSKALYLENNIDLHYSYKNDYNTFNFSSNLFKMAKERFAYIITNRINGYDFYYKPFMKYNLNIENIRQFLNDTKLFKNTNSSKVPLLERLFYLKDIFKFKTLYTRTENGRYSHSVGESTSFTTNEKTLIEFLNQTFLANIGLENQFQLACLNENTSYYTDLEKHTTRNADDNKTAQERFNKITNLSARLKDTTQRLKFYNRNGLSENIMMSLLKYKVAFSLLVAMEEISNEIKVFIQDMGFSTEEKATDRVVANTS
jgi:hypothetical protein